MIISSSAVKMNAQRNFRSMSMWRANVGFVGQLSNTASSSEKNKVSRDPDKNPKQQNLPDSQADLMARFSQSRSIRGSGLESMRGLRAMHQIRSQSIGYMLHQMFWRGSQQLDPLSALFNDYSGGSFYHLGIKPAILNLKKPVLQPKAKS